MPARAASWTSSTSSPHPGKGTVVTLKKFLPRRSAAVTPAQVAQSCGGVDQAASRGGPVRGVAAAESGTAGDTGGTAQAAGRAFGAQPGVGGYQSRGSGAVRGTGREGRPSAARRPDQDALPLQYEPRIPHACQFDSGARQHAAEPSGQPHGWRGAAAGNVHEESGGRAAGTGERPSGPGQSGSRQSGSAARGVRCERSVQRAARHAAAPAGEFRN